MRPIIVSIWIFGVALLQAQFNPLAGQSPAPSPDDAQYQAKGEQDRTYLFPGTTERIPYHLYVPAKWDKNTKLPLVVVTHGANQPATAPFVRGNAALAKIAEERGFIVVAVTGYHANATGVGGWNVPYPMVPTPRPAAAAGQGNAAAGGRGAGGAAGAAGAAAGAGRGAPQAPATVVDFQRAEQDILNVADLVAKEYNADPNRVYLMGNSAGGSAVWNVGAKFPERWTAISPQAAPLEDTQFPYDRLKNLPVLVVHGDQDTTMFYDGSKVMVDHAKQRGVDATFLGVAGGSHTEAWTVVLPQIFDFFDKHRTKK